MKKRVALIFGSGAVENSWEPIFNCLTPKDFKKKLTIEAANTALALLVYNLRFWSTDIQSDNYKKSFNILHRTRLGISAHIQYYQQNGLINIRPEFDQILSKFILTGFNGFLFITTNWDTVVDDVLKSHPLIRSYITNNKEVCMHLHGSFNEPNLIYLPTEVIEEAYRTQEEKLSMGKLLRRTYKSLLIAEKIVLYGLSLSPLDVELMQLLGSSISKNVVLKVVQIIDINHEVIADKMHIILDKNKKVKVEGIHPERLDIIYDHS